MKEFRNLVFCLTDTIFTIAMLSENEFNLLKKVHFECFFLPIFLYTLERAFREADKGESDPTVGGFIAVASIVLEPKEWETSMDFVRELCVDFTYELLTAGTEGEVDPTLN